MLLQFDVKKIITSAIVLFAFAFSAVAVDDVANKTVNVTSRARIITPITLENTGAQALDFGVIARGTSESVIVVAAAESPSIDVESGDAVVLTSSEQTAAKFTVGGEADKAYAITIPTTTQTISDGTHTLNLTNFTCSNNSGSTIGAADIFYVGAKLTIPSDATAATYTGSFVVTVAYN